MIIRKLASLPTIALNWLSDFVNIAQVATMKNVVFQILVFGIAMISLIAMLEQLCASAYLNKAHIQMGQAMLGQHELDLLDFQVAAKLLPNNAHIKWRLVDAKTFLGRYDDAVHSALELLRNGYVDKSVIHVLSWQLIKADRGDDAIDLYLSLPKKTHLSQTFVAYVALQFLERDGKLPDGFGGEILTDSLRAAIHSKEIGLLSNEWLQESFWSSDVGVRLRLSIEWKSQLPAIAKTYSHYNDNQFIHDIATALKIPETAIVISSDLSVNGNFELQDLCPMESRIVSYNCLVDWSPSIMSNIYPWNNGFFIVGIDNQESYSGNNALRIDGVSTNQQPDLETARAGAWHQSIQLGAHLPYMISFVYRTALVQGSKTSLYIGSQSEDFHSKEYYLEPTNEHWNRFVIIFWNTTDKSVTIHPLLRLWDIGTVWFDAFSIRALTFKEPLVSHETIWNISTIEQYPRQ